MKAEEAKKKAQVESERQIMRAFFATEELRLEVILLLFEEHLHDV